MSITSNIKKIADIREKMEEFLDYGLVKNFNNLNGFDISIIRNLIYPSRMMIVPRKLFYKHVFKHEDVVTSCFSEKTLDFPLILFCSNDIFKDLKTIYDYGCMNDFKTILFDRNHDYCEHNNKYIKNKEDLQINLIVGLKAPVIRLAVVLKEISNKI